MNIKSLIKRIGNSVYVKEIEQSIVSSLQKVFDYFTNVKAVFKGTVDFTDATVEGLSGGGGLESPLTDDLEIEMADYEVSFVRDGGPVKTIGPNLITNGTFTSGIDGWTGDITWDNINERAVISGDAYYNFTAPSTGQYFISFDIQPGVIASQYTNTGLYTESSVKMYAFTTLDAGSETLGIATYYQAPGQTMWIDNVEVYQIDTILADMQIGDASVITTPLGFAITQNWQAALQSNYALGTNALLSNTTGYWNYASGVNALRSNTTGNTNYASGFNALFSNTTGNTNCAVGSYALYSSTTGSNNTAIGYQAANTGNWTNVIAIGYQSAPDADDQIVLGNPSSTQFKVGNYRFDINQTVGAAQDGYVLKYDHASGEIRLVAP